MLSIRPLSTSQGELELLQDRVNKLTRALVDSLDPHLPHQDFMKVKQELEKALGESNDYFRFLRAGRHLLHINASSREFDDHDQLSSTLLYLSSRFEKMQESFGAPSRRTIRHLLLQHLGYASARRANEFVEDNPEPPTPARGCDIGVLTVLEHEYQSVVRRLEELIVCADDHFHGFRILDRMHAIDDLKDSFQPLGGDRLGMGWAVGAINSKRVVVVCTGYAGRDTASSCKATAERWFGIPKKGWLVVGICAGTNSRWPIGSVLVSHERICCVQDPATMKYVFDSELPAPLTLTGSHPATFPAEHLFRRAPTGLGPRVAIAKPKKLPVHLVKFACTRDVVNKTDAREAIRRCLIERQFLRVGEEFGIEMEGPGVSVYNESTMCIVKGVCDHADDMKGDPSWKQSKVLYQLYASETAAEYAYRVIRDW